MIKNSKKANMEKNLSDIDTNAPISNPWEEAAGKKRMVRKHKVPTYVKVLLLVLVAVIGIAAVGMGSLLKNALSQFGMGKASSDPVGQAMEIQWADTYVDDGVRQADVDSDTVKWICATYALNVAYEKLANEYNGYDADASGAQYDTVGMFEPSKETRESCREFLDSAWGITNRASAIRTINKVLEHGSREKYPDVVERLKNEKWIGDNLYIDDVLEHYSEEESLRYWGAYQAWQKYEKQGIDAWDYCRVIRVCGMCYVAGYFNLTESLEQSLPIARHLQEEFDSWEALAYDYAYGYQFWAKAESERTIGGIYENLTAMLLVEQGMKEGPFTLDFHTKLEKTW